MEGGWQVLGRRYSVGTGYDDGLEGAWFLVPMAPMVLAAFTVIWYFSSLRFLIVPYSSCSSIVLRSYGPTVLQFLHFSASHVLPPWVLSPSSFMLIIKGKKKNKKTWEVLYTNTKNAEADQHDKK